MLNKLQTRHMSPYSKLLSVEWRNFRETKSVHIQHFAFTAIYTLLFYKCWARHACAYLNVCFLSWRTLSCTHTRDVLTDDLFFNSVHECWVLTFVITDRWWKHRTVSYVITLKKFIYSLVTPTTRTQHPNTLPTFYCRGEIKIGRDNVQAN